MNELIFKLSESEFIKIVGQDYIDFKNIEYCCSQITASFCDQEECLKIGQQTAGEFFEACIKKLKKVINNELPLHESLTQNLGLMQNQYYQDKSGFFMVLKKFNSKPSWVGFNYDVWSTYGDAHPLVTTWLYNDKQGNIMFEVTKDYPWHFIELDDLQDPDFITYEDFMKDYKPLILRVISREVAIVWLEQAMQAYRSFFKNEEDYIRACNEMNDE